MIKLNMAVTPHQREFHTTGVLKKLPENWLENIKGTIYGYSEVTVTHPSGSQQTIDVTTYENSLDKNHEAFQVGKTVGIILQLDGEFAGRTKLSLAGVREMDLSEYDFSSKPTAKEIIAENVVEKEFVT